MSNKKTPAFDYALHFLHSVPKTRKQMEIKLLQKWYSEKEIEKTILELEKMDWINDTRFAKMYLQSEAINKWKPLFRVKWKLIEKWIDKNLIEKISKDLQEDINDGIKNKLKKEIQKLKEKWLDWYDIMTKLYNRGYNIWLLKQVVDSGE